MADQFRTQFVQKILEEMLDRQSSVKFRKTDLLMELRGSVNNSQLALWLSDFHLPKIEIMIKQIEVIKTDKEKNITAKQMVSALKDWFEDNEIKSAVTYHVVEYMMSLIDEDHDGTINKDEFLEAFNGNHDPANEGYAYLAEFVNEFPNKGGLFEMISSLDGLKNDGLISVDGLYAVSGPWIESHHLDLLNVVARTKTGENRPTRQRNNYTMIHLVISFISPQTLGY